MRMCDLIRKKRDGEALTREELHVLIQGYTKGTIPDYQMAAFLMAVYFQGMTPEETVAMTLETAHSGDMVDLSRIRGVTVDKHSTGGVGDKTTLIVAPAVAACGVKVAKMSGRGLGHTGGTVDKLESIPGFQTSLEEERFFEVVEQTGLSLIGQTGNLTPADKRMYALRDVTATVESIPLIAVSIMSKKLAAGSDCIMLDVKTGSGAFMKTMEDSLKLAREMVSIGERAGRKTAALITDMDVPLGYYIGNRLEVAEALSVLRGEGPEDLTEVSVELAAHMLYLARQKMQGASPDMEACREEIRRVLADGSALQCLKAMVKAQGGEVSVLEDPRFLEQADFSHEVVSPRSGYLSRMDVEGCGIASCLLGAGRETKESTIDFTAGIILRKKTGDPVKEGEILAVFHGADEKRFPEAEKKFLESLVFSKESPRKKPLILATVTKEEIRVLAGNPCCTASSFCNSTKEETRVLAGTPCVDKREGSL